jgi:hypothetical protein
LAVGQNSQYAGLGGASLTLTNTARYGGLVQKRAPHAVRSGAVGQTWRLVPPGQRHFATSANCSDVIVITFWRSPPRHPVDSILTTHFEGALGPDDRDHGLRYLWLPDRASLRIIMCGLLNADDYVTTTRGSHEGRACSQLPKSPRTRQPIVPDQVAERALRQPATQ